MMLHALAVTQGWQTIRIDYELVLPQEPLDKEVFDRRMKSRPGDKKKSSSWKSKVDACPEYKGNVAYILCTDDAILARPEE